MSTVSGFVRAAIERLGTPSAASDAAVKRPVVLGSPPRCCKGDVPVAVEMAFASKLISR